MGESVNLLNTIQSVTPTICSLFGIQPPSTCAVEPSIEVLNELRRNQNVNLVERALIYAPDAIGSFFLKKHHAIYESFRQVGRLEIPLRSMTPPKTPVCFASMFSGAPPEIHGIRRYERPVLAINTLFDSLVKAGKRVALVAVKDCSIDIIFRNRPLDFFSEPYDPEVTARTLELLRLDEHDFILAYHQEYDDLLHRTTPYSPEAIAAAKRHADSLEILVKAAEKAWQGKRWVAAATPDHGGHIRPDGRGDHCDDIPEDMEVTHFWRL